MGVVGAASWEQGMQEWVMFVGAMVLWQGWCGCGFGWGFGVGGGSKMQCLLSSAASRLDRLAILIASQLIALKTGGSVTDPVGCGFAVAYIGLFILELDIEYLIVWGVIRLARSRL